MYTRTCVYSGVQCEHVSTRTRTKASCSSILHYPGLGSTDSGPMLLTLRLPPVGGSLSETESQGYLPSAGAEGSIEMLLASEGQHPSLGP